MLHGRGLLVDQNRDFTNAIQDEGDARYPLVFASTLTQAMTLLRHDEARISIAFVSTSVPPANGLDVVREIRQLRPSLPIILVDHYDFPRATPAQAEGLGCLALLLKPTKAEDLFSPVLKRLEEQTTWKGVAATADQKEVTLDKEDGKYLAVSAKDYLLTPKSFFNLFIRLSKGKFVKVLNAGEEVERGFLERYLGKGITHFYVMEEEHTRYISLCDRMVAEAAKRDVPTEARTERVLHLGENVRQGLYRSGITPERLHYADNFLGHTDQMVRRMKMENAAVGDMMASLLAKDHVAVVIMLSGLLAQEMGFESSKAVKIVGMAALFHDIGLYNLLPDLQREDPSRLSLEDRATWEAHPARGEEMLRTVGGFDEVVYQSVLQHHMRKKGGQGGKRNMNINVVSEIIGMVDEFHNQVLEGEYSKERLDQFMDEGMKLFSPQVEKAFLKVLKGRE